MPTACGTHLCAVLWKYDEVEAGVAQLCALDEVGYALAVGKDLVMAFAHWHSIIDDLQEGKKPRYKVFCSMRTEINKQPSLHACNVGASPRRQPEQQTQRKRVSFKATPWSSAHDIQ